MGQNVCVAPLLSLEVFRVALVSQSLGILQNPISWTLYGLIASQLGDVTDERILLTDGTSDQTVAQFVRSDLGFKHSYVPVALACLLGFVILFWLLAVMAVRFLNFQKR